MQHPLQITFRHMDFSPAVEARILAEVEALERAYERITSCRVVVEAPHHHRERGQTFKVSLELHVPGRQIHVNHGPAFLAEGEAACEKKHEAEQGHSDVYVAVRDAFAAARRQLQDHARVLRGEVKHHALQETSVC